MISEEKNEAMSGSESSSSDDMSSHISSSTAAAASSTSVHSAISAAITVSAGGQAFPGANGLNMSQGAANPLQSFIQGAAQVAQAHGQQGGRPSAGHNLMHYAQDSNPFFLPSSLTAAAASNSSSSSPSGGGGMGSLGGGQMGGGLHHGMGGGQGGGHHHQHDGGVGGGMPGEPNKKREIRLMKNREAARECRRKKKEYIKCLENRVAVLENQNKQLIEELKSLKELYTGKQVRKSELP